MWTPFAWQTVHRPPFLHQRAYTQDDLLACAHACGFSLAKDTLREWITLGLLGKATEQTWPGRGHGSGSLATWSPQQCSLLLTLLAHKQKDPHNMPLCDFPVWRWLYGEGLAGVDLAQVKRAVSTWQQGYRRNSQKQRSVRKHARELVHEHAHPRATGIRDVINEITTIAREGKVPDEDEMETLFALISDPQGIRKRNDPKGETPPPENPGRTLSLQARAAALSLDEIPDPLWELARVGLLLTRERYQVAQADQERAGAAAERTPLPRASLSVLIDGSCFLLLHALAIFQRGVHPQLEAHLHPRNWLTGEATATIKTWFAPTALFLPDGQPLLQMHTTVTISYRGRAWPCSFSLPLL